MGDRLSADNSFFSSAESIKSNGVLPSRLSRMTLLIWQQTSRVSSTLSLFRLVPFGMILLINLWLLSTWGFCHDAWGSQKNTWVRINPGRVCSKALGFLNSTPLSVRITPKSLLNSAVPRDVNAIIIVDHFSPFRYWISLLLGIHPVRFLCSKSYEGDERCESRNGHVLPYPFLSQWRNVDPNYSQNTWHIQADSHEVLWWNYYPG